ncbi:MAG: maleylpyruvate isomerase family mycothiol-dependent enzyme [Actinomycetota bacterium]
MTDDRDLRGLDPYDLMDREAARLDGFFATLAASEWERPSRCAGWSVRAVLAHLASSEDYNRACLDGTVQDFLAQLGARGATDLATANDLGVRDYADQAPTEILDQWRSRNADNRKGFRARDGGDVDSSIGAYPTRWQAFHLAFELAVHADDVGVPLDPADVRDRTTWLAQFGRFAIKELRADAQIEAADGITGVRGDGVDVELPDEEFVTAVAARLPADHGLDPDAREYLSATP